MSFMSGHELCEAVETHLAHLGYKVFGDPEEGWSWELDGYQPSVPACDSRGEAAQAALADLVQRTDELLDAAQQVAERWERGDLAADVRELQMCIEALRERTEEPAKRDEPPDGQDEARQGWLVHGEGADGPWSDGAYLDLEAASAAAQHRATGLIDEGHQLDIAALASALTQQGFACASSPDRSVWVEVVPIQVR